MYHTSVKYTILSNTFSVLNIMLFSTLILGDFSVQIDIWFLEEKNFQAEKKKYLAEKS